MSLLWREQICIALTPLAVTCARWSPLSVRRRPPQVALPVADANARSGAWQPALEVLRGCVAEAAVRRGDVRVVLSNHFVRFLVAPWNHSLTNFGERRAHAEHLFRATYGSMVDRWQVRVSSGSYGAPVLACAVDAELLDGLSALFAASPWRLAAVQPLLMVAFNQFRRDLGESACLFVREPGRLCCATWGAGRWQAVRATRVSADCGEAHFERERQILGVSEDTPAFLYDATDPFALAPRSGAWRALSTSSVRRPDAALALFGLAP